MIEDIISANLIICAFKIDREKSENHREHYWIYGILGQFSRITNFFMDSFFCGFA